MSGAGRDFVGAMRNENNLGVCLLADSIPQGKHPATVGLVESLAGFIQNQHSGRFDYGPGDKNLAQLTGREIQNFNQTVPAPLFRTKRPTEGCRGVTSEYPQESL